MSLTMPQPSEGGTFENCPAGNHIAVCTRVIDLGTQRIVFDKEVKHQRKIYVGWEIPDELMEDGRPFMVGKRYTYSSHEKATLRQHLEAWRNRKFEPKDFGENGFHIKKILGVGCMIQVVHTERDGKHYANVQSVGSLPKGVANPEPAGDVIFFSLEEDEIDLNLLDTLSERMQETIRESPEYQAAAERDLASTASAKTKSVDDFVDDDESPF